MDCTLYETRRRVFTSQSFRETMKAALGSVCVNCQQNAEETYVEYHHIVPLALGGTNNLSNIVPLCRECHQLVHGAKDVKKINRNTPGRTGGRPRFKPVENYKEILDKFIRGEVGKSQCQKLLGMKAGKLNDMDFYQQYLKDRDIICVRNLVDGIRSECSDDRIVSYVVYSDGKRFDYCKNGKVIDSKDMATVVNAQQRSKR